MQQGVGLLSYICAIDGKLNSIDVTPPQSYPQETLRHKARLVYYNFPKGKT
jgi:hypothetical protein